MIDSFDAVAGQIQTGSYYTDRGAGDFFPDPFADMASLAMPQTIESAFRWCQFILSANGTYRSALERTVRYFLTDIKVDGDDLARAQKTDIEDYLHNDLDIMTVLEAVLMDRECYGNDFESLLERFRRYYICGNRECRFELAFDQMETLRNAGSASWQDFGMTATCPKCRVKSTWKIHDRRGGTGEDHYIKRWSPLEISLLWDPYSERPGHMWKIPEEERRGIREGRPDVLREAPMEVIEAVKSDSYIRIGRDIVHHGKNLAMAGTWHRGWGIPRVLANFRQAWYVQVLHRFNEAIALDYVMPFRLITPKSGGSEANDPLMNVDMANHQGRVEEMLRQHRKDPAGYNFLPFGVEYQTLGGEASQLAPYQLMDQGQADLLDACNVPVQLYKMDLTVQGATPALRLFESVHRGVPRTANRLLAHVMKRLTLLKGWPPAKASLIPTSLIDDMNKQMPRLQLMSSGQVSPQTGMATIGLDAFDEAKQTLEYQEFQAETQQKMQDNMTDEEQQRQMQQTPLMQLQQQQQAAAQGGQPQGQPASSPAFAQGQAQGPPPGAAGQFMGATPMGGNIPVDPQDTLSQAQAIASQLGSMPESQKNQTLQQIKGQNELLHLAVKDQLRKQREQIRMQAGDQAMGKTGLHAASAMLGLELP